MKEKALGEARLRQSFSVLDAILKGEIDEAVAGFNHCDSKDIENFVSVVTAIRGDLRDKRQEPDNKKKAGKG